MLGWTEALLQDAQAAITDYQAKINVDNGLRAQGMPNGVLGYQKTKSTQSLQAEMNKLQPEDKQRSNKASAKLDDRLSEMLGV